MDDDRALREAVRRKRAQAEALGIPAAALSFIEEAQHFPEWRTTYPQGVPPSLSQIRSLLDDPDDFYFKTRLEFELGRNHYRVSSDKHFESHVVDVSTTVKIEVNGVVVIQFSATGEFRQDDPTIWSTSSIDSFIDGPWTQEFRSLCTETSEHAERRMEEIIRDALDPPVPADEARARFGITDRDLREAAQETTRTAEESRSPDDRPEQPPAEVGALSGLVAVFRRLARVLRSNA